MLIKGSTKLFEIQSTLVYFETFLTINDCNFMTPQFPCNETTTYTLRKMPCSIHDILADHKTRLSKMKRRQVSIEQAAYDIIKQWSEKEAA